MKCRVCIWICCTCKSAVSVLVTTFGKFIVWVHFAELLIHSQDVCGPIDGYASEESLFTCQYWPWSVLTVFSMWSEETVMDMTRHFFSVNSLDFLMPPVADSGCCCYPTRVSQFGRWNLSGLQVGRQMLRFISYINVWHMV